MVMDLFLSLAKQHYIVLLIEGRLKFYDLLPYYPTPLLPFHTSHSMCGCYPARVGVTMNPFDIILPSSIPGLKLMYIFVNKRLDKVWREYSNYVESLYCLPQTTLIFPILFSELDFYESLLNRIIRILPEEDLHELQNAYYFSDW